MTCYWLTNGSDSGEWVWAHSKAEAVAFMRRISADGSWDA